MSTLDRLRQEKRAIILRLTEQHGCRNIRVFGSVATGDSRAEGDIDFLVDLEEGRNLFDLGGLLADLKDALASDVDLVEARCLHPYIRDRVPAEALPL